MQARYLALERLGGTAVVDHVVSRGEALLTRRLRGENGANLRLGQTASSHHATDLSVLRAVHDEHARGARPVDAAFHQERDHENRVGTRGALDAAAAFGPYQGMQYRLEPLPRLGVGESEPAHPGAIERAVRRDRLRAERRGYGYDRLASRPSQVVCEFVGIDHLHAEPREHPGNRALPAADPARESDGVGFHMNWLKYWRVSWGPQNSATIPAAPR